jgi:hypothetical protein
MRRNEGREGLRGHQGAWPSGFTFVSSKGRQKRNDLEGETKNTRRKPAYHQLELEKKIETNRFYYSGE